MTKIHIFLPASEIPSGSAVTKDISQPNQLLLEEVIFTNKFGSVQTIKPIAGNLFLVTISINNTGNIELVQKDQNLFWVASIEEVQKCIDSKSF